MPARIIAASLDRAVIARRLGTVGSVLCASPNLLSRIGEPAAPEALAGRPCVTYARFGSRPSLEANERKTLCCLTTSTAASTT